MSFVRLPFHRWTFGAVLALGLALLPSLADARVGGGSSFGSRGSRTFSAPPTTTTAPRTAAPVERSMTPQSTAGASAQGPAFGGGFFGGGLGRGFLGGLLGAGLFGLMFGHGLMGGFGGIGSLFGLILQLGLVYLLVRWAMNWFGQRQQPGAAGVMSGGPGFSAFQGAFGGSGGGVRPAAGVPLDLQKADFDQFERLLGAVQEAYGAENLDRLRTLATPEMAAYFAQDLAENARQGVINRLSDVRLLQGDLAEAWREGMVEYATVALRFSLIDVMLERGSNRIVSGDASHASEAREVWTFVRPAGTGTGSWMLSAIQQA